MGYSLPMARNVFGIDGCNNPFFC